MAWRIRLRGVSDGVKGRTWESLSSLRAGRLRTLEMPLDDSSVSRRHAEVRLSNAGWIVRDLGSTNGTFLNGARIGTGEWPIKEFDTIRFGDVAFVVEMADVGEGESRGSESRPTPGHCKRLWQVVIPGPGNRPLATPAIANGKVFVGGGFGSHRFYAFPLKPANSCGSIAPKMMDLPQPSSRMILLRSTPKAANSKF
jgi:FHA domain/PQQ-like domain